LLPCLHRFGDCAVSVCDVAEGLRSSVEIVDNLNMAIPYIAAERGFIDAVIEPDGTLVAARYGGWAAEDRPPARELTARHRGRRRRVHLP
jgi:acetyl-CoA carboxylase carboxyltransferase component